MVQVRRDGKYWGKTEGDTYFTRRNNNHYCRKYAGWGIQYDLFEQLKAAHIKRIIILAPDGHYLSSLENWDKHGTIDVLRFEDGEQIFLPKAMMERILQ